MMNYADEFPIASGPSGPNYDPGIEQIDNLIRGIGPELYLVLLGLEKKKSAPHAAL